MAEAQAGKEAVKVGEVNQCPTEICQECLCFKTCEEAERPDPEIKKATKIYMQEDTAGNRYFSEFEDGSTAPIRTWVERPELRPWEMPLPEHHSNR